MNGWIENGWMDRQMMDGWTYRQTDRQTDRQSGQRANLAYMCNIVTGFF